MNFGDGEFQMVEFLPAFPNQGAFSKYIMSIDRGRSIRTEEQYRQLAGKFFNKVDACVNTNPLRIPYVTIVLECEK